MPPFNMPPYLIWYMNYHPELFQREFTNAELATIAAVSLGVTAVVISVLYFIYRSFNHD